MDLGPRFWWEFGSNSINVILAYTPLESVVLPTPTYRSELNNASSNPIKINP